MAEKILIVDDDQDTLRLVGLMLQRNGYEVIAASNGHQAILMAKNEIPDLIVLDVMMPDMDGIEVTRQLRSSEDTKNVPIIMFTAKVQLEDKILGFEAGADDYLTKPTQPRELIAHVKAVLSRVTKSKTSQLPKPATGPLEKGLVVGVLAPRGGLGVTTLVLNLGTVLRERTKKNVLIADYRPGQGTLGLEMGYLRSEGLNRLLQRKPDEITIPAIEAELSIHPTGLRMLLASAQPRDAQYLAAIEKFEAITQRLAYMSSYVLLDLGVSLTPLVDKVLPCVDQLLLVVEPVPQTILQAKAMLDDLRARGFGEGRVEPVLINRARTGMQLPWGQVQEQLGRSVPMIFTPAPEMAYQATLNNKPMVIVQPESLTTQQFIKLAEKIAQPNPA